MVANKHVVHLWTTTSCPPSRTDVGSASTSHEGGTDSETSASAIAHGRSVVLHDSCAGLACVVGPGPVPLPTTFDPSEVMFINELGTNRVKGSAFVRQQGSGLVGRAGNEVYLVPRGAYSTERMGIIYGKTSDAGFNLVQPV